MRRDLVNLDLGLLDLAAVKELCGRLVPGAFYAYLDLLRLTDRHAQPLLEGVVCDFFPLCGCLVFADP
ncbi:hypothetical protein [Micromonospora sp. NPDC005220]|uniref:hypothetical protein n=1 Tax=Micromonospora sp. NPDC005220 TaxID=3155589 RepID=UPI00339DB248